tara:strand:- start:334 stop:534 length:201 start_codon:yes stop_codon:yes gene_type:complete
MFYLGCLLLAILISMVTGVAWIVLNYHIEIKVIEKSCFWCGEIEEPSDDEITEIRWERDDQKTKTV